MMMELRKKVNSYSCCTDVLRHITIYYGQFFKFLFYDLIVIFGHTGYTGANPENFTSIYICRKCEYIENEN